MAKSAPGLRPRRGLGPPWPWLSRSPRIAGVLPCVPICIPFRDSHGGLPITGGHTRLPLRPQSRPRSRPRSRKGIQPAGGAERLSVRWSPGRRSHGEHLRSYRRGHTSTRNGIRVRVPGTPRVPVQIGTANRGHLPARHPGRRRDLARRQFHRRGRCRTLCRHP